MLFCTSCGKEISEGAQFCGSCGSDQNNTPNSCNSCGKVLEENEKFCSGCGTPTASAVEPKVETKPKQESKPKKDKLTPEGRKIISGGPKPDTQQQAPTIPPSGIQSKKKKKGCLGCLGKSLLIILILLIIGVVIIWNLPDDDEEKLSDTNISGIVDIETNEDSNSSEPEEQILTSNNIKELNVDLSRSQTVVGDLNKNGIQLNIPKETFDQNVNLQVKESKSAPAFDKKRAKLIGIPFDISIDQKSKRLNNPITIKLKLSKQEVSHIKHTNDLRIGYFNGSQWDYFKPQEINIKDEFVKFETYHLSDYSKADLTKEERIIDFANEKAMDQWSKNNNNAPTRKATEKIVRQILGEHLGLTDKNLTQNIVESILNESGYAKLLVSYNDNNMEQFGQDVAILAGKKIVKIVTNDSRAKLLLGGVTEHASKINAGFNIARSLSDGNLEEAAKELSREIINTFPMTKLFREAARVIDLQIVSWKDKEVDAAFKVYVNGAQSSIPFWGYDVEPGNFEDVWIQMKGLKPQLLRDAKNKYAKANGIKVEDLGTRILDIIEEQTKNNLEQKFIKRAKQEKEIEKMKEQNLKLLEVFESSRLLEEGRFGYPDNTSFDLRLERLYKIKDMILKDTRCHQVGFLGIAEGGIIPATTVARLIRIWYNPDDGKEKYHEELVKLGYIKEVEELELAESDLEIIDGMERIDDENKPERKTGRWVQYDIKAINGSKGYSNKCHKIGTCVCNAGSFKFSKTNICSKPPVSESISGTYTVPPKIITPGDKNIFEVTFKRVNFKNGGWASMSAKLYNTSEGFEINERGDIVQGSREWNQTIVHSNHSRYTSYNEFIFPDNLNKKGVLRIDAGFTMGNFFYSAKNYYLYKWQE